MSHAYGRCCLILFAFLLSAATPPEPVRTAADYDALLKALQASMRAKGLIYDDEPASVVAEVAKANAAVAAGDFGAAMRALGEAVAWADNTKVDLAFVQAKFGRASGTARAVLRLPALADDQRQGLYTRLDKIGEALSQERVADTNTLINDLFELLKTLPRPEPKRPETMSP